MLNQSQFVIPEIWTGVIWVDFDTNFINLLVPSLSLGAQSGLYFGHLLTFLLFKFHIEW